MWHFVEHGAHYHVPEIHMNRFINKKLLRRRISPEIVVFTEGACLGPPSGGSVYASTPILHDPVEGHQWYGYYWLICSTRVSIRGYGTPNFEKTSKIRQIPPLPPQ